MTVVDDSVATRLLRSSARHSYDPEVDLDIPTSKRDLPEGDIVALNNSFGFGGANVAVAFGSV